MRVANVETKVKSCELHSCLRHLLMICRWAGFFPIEGLNQENVHVVRFNVRSLYMIYLIVTFIGQVVITILSFYWFVTNYVSLNHFSNLVFNLIALLSNVIIFRLAKHWPALIRFSAEIENSLRDIRVSTNTVLKTRAVASVLLTLACVEHILSTLFNIRMVTSCSDGNNYSAVVESYFRYRLAYVFEKYVNINVCSGAFGELLIIQGTFLWSFTDILIMSISIYLTSFFQDLNTAIYSYKNKYLIPWNTMRLHHSRLVILLNKIDKQMNPFVLISTFCNLFFICLQLFMLLHRNYSKYELCDTTGIKKVMNSPDYLLYYIFSFLFLMTRAFLVCFCAANVNTTAKRPLQAVYDVPSALYSLEVQRFQRQLCYTTIGLSGMCFYVTRKMILRVIGTIVTYELVLLQFSK